MQLALKATTIVALIIDNISLVNEFRCLREKQKDKKYRNYFLKTLHLACARRREREIERIRVVDDVCERKQDRVIHPPPLRITFKQFFFFKRKTKQCTKKISLNLL